MKRSITHHDLGSAPGVKYQRNHIGSAAALHSSKLNASLAKLRCQGGMLLHQGRGYNVYRFTASASANQANPTTSTPVKPTAAAAAAVYPAQQQQQELSDEYEEEYETEEEVTDETATPSNTAQQQGPSNTSTAGGPAQGVSAGTAPIVTGAPGAAGAAGIATAAGKAGYSATPTGPITPATHAQASAQPASSSAMVTAGGGGTSASRPASLVHQGAAAPLPLASLSTPLTPAASQLQATVGGWVTAAALLAAIRLSRAAAEDERLDARALQLRQGESRLQSSELREKRRAYLEAERAAREAEAARRLAEARKKSEEEAAARAAREAEYREAAKKETARLWAAQEAARQEFLAQESRMSEELAKRTAAELRVREEAEAKRKEEEARRRVLEQEAAARRAAAARAKAAEEEAARQAAAAARAEEKKRIRAAQTRISVTLNGALTAQVPPPGTWVDRSTGQAAGSIQEAMESSTVSASSGTSSRSGTPNLPILARMRVQIAGSCSKAQLQPPASTGSDTSSVTSIAIGGTRPAPVSLQVSDIRQSQVTRLYESADVAVEETASLAAMLPTFSDVRSWLQHQSQQQPGAALDTLELEHWRRLSLCQWAAVAERTAAQVVPLAGAAEPLEQPFTVTLSRAILPLDHYASMRGRLADAAAAVAQGSLKEAAEMVDRAIEEEEDMLLAVAGQGGLVLDPAAALLEVLPPLALPALVYAHLMDRGAAAAGVGVTAAAHAPLSSPTGSSSSSGGGSGSNSGSERGTSRAGSAKASNGTTSGVSGSEEGGESSDGGDSDGERFQRSPSPSPEAQGVHEAGWGPEASALHDQFTSLARYQLEGRTRGVGLDELAPTARVISLALGPRHPITQIMTTLAQRNQSVATRLKMEARKQQREAEAAAALLKAQLPGQLALDPSSPSSRTAMIPVPERLWAVRNVALKLVQFGSDPSQVAEALSMLEGAVDLAEGHYGVGHPSCLNPLLDLIDALRQVDAPDEPDEDVAAAEEGSSSTSGKDGAQRKGRTAAGVASSALDIVSAVCERFKEQGDALSLVVLAESAARELGPLIPRSDTRLLSLQREAADAFYALSPPEARVAMARRSTSGTSPLRSLAREFAEEPGVYAASRRGPSRVEQWARGLKLAPLR